MHTIAASGYRKDIPLHTICSLLKVTYMYAGNMRQYGHFEIFIFLLKDKQFPS